MKVSVFPVYIVWTRFREQFWSWNGAINFCFLKSHNVRLVKIKEGQQLKFFTSNAFDVYANKFQSTDKFISTCAIFFFFFFNEEDPVFFSFVWGSNLFWFSKFNWSSKKKNRKSRKIHILGKSRYNLYFAKFHTEILWWNSIHCEPTSHNCHTELPCDLSEQHRCIFHSQLCNLSNTKIQFLIPNLTVHCLQVWRMMRESAFHSLRVRRPYPMPCKFFCKGGIETWDLGSFRYPQPGREEWSN